MVQDKRKMNKEKGITSIVAVVLLIAIAVIAGISIYFWTAGIATKQPTPEQPNSIIANPLPGGKVLIANLGRSNVNTSTLKTSDPNLVISCDKQVIAPGEQVLCTIKGVPSSDKIVIYGTGTGSTLLETASFSIEDNPPVINWVADNSTDGEIPLGWVLNVSANVTDDIGISSVWLNNTTADIRMASIGGNIYSVDVLPKTTGTYQYFVKANDTSDQWVQSDTCNVSVVQNWIREYGSNQKGWSIEKTSNGYVVGGDSFIMGMNKTGSSMWRLSVSSISPIYWDILHTSDGNFIAVGTGYATNYPSIAIKFNSDGQVIWAHEYLDVKDIKSACEVEDGYIFTGYKGYYAYILKVNKTTGDPVWVNNITSFSGAVAYCAPVNSTHVAVLIGARPGGSMYPRIGFIDKDGTASNFKIYRYSYLYPTKIRRISSGYLVIGKKWESAGYNVLFIMKLDNNLNFEWGKLISHGTTSFDAYSTAELGDGDIVIAGSIGSGAPLVVSLLSNGSLYWAKKYADTSSTSEWMGDITNTSDGGFIATGCSNSQILIVKAGKSGELGNCTDYVNLDLSISGFSPSIYGTTISMVGETSSTQYPSPASGSALGSTCICQPFGC